MSHVLSLRNACIALAALCALPLLATAAEPPAGAAPVEVTPPAAESAPAATSAPTPKEVVTATPVPPRLLIGLVDIVRLGKESEEGKTTQVKLMEKLDKYKARMAAKQKQLEKQKSAIEAKLPSMTPEQRAAKGKEFDKKVDAFRKQAQSGEKELLTAQEEMTGKLLKKIEQAAAAYGTRGGYAAIAVKKDLLYVSAGVESVDVTDALIGEMNAPKVNP